jgi:hypothetical protein
MTARIDYSLPPHLINDLLYKHGLKVSGVIMGGFEIDRIDGKPFDEQRDGRKLKIEFDNFAKFVGILLGNGAKDYLTRLWLDEFLSENGHCGLCGNTGKIDTKGKMTTPSGAKCGIKAWCICPNGRGLREASGGQNL